MEFASWEEQGAQNSSCKDIFLSKCMSISLYVGLFVLTRSNKYKEIVTSNSCFGTCYRGSDPFHQSDEFSPKCPNGLKHEEKTTIHLPPIMRWIWLGFAFCYSFHWLSLNMRWLLNIFHLIGGVVILSFFIKRKWAIDNVKKTHLLQE